CLSPGFFQTRPEVAQAFDSLLSALQCIKSKIDLFAAGNTEQKVANCCGRKAFVSQIAKRVIVAFRLGHRLAFDFQVLKVQPVTYELLSRRAFTLSDFILMMRKNQIDAPKMKVEGFAQILHRHRRTLYVPARSTATYLSVPGRFVRTVGSFPESKIARVFLVVLVCVDALAAA